MLEIILIEIDVIKAYLENAFGQNKQPIFMKIFQKCLVSQEDLVCKILKSLYRLKQVMKLWNMIIIRFFQRIGFTSTNMGICILTIKWKRDIIILENLCR